MGYVHNPYTFNIENLKYNIYTEIEVGNIYIEINCRIQCGSIFYHEANGRELYLIGYDRRHNPEGLLKYSGTGDPPLLYAINSGTTNRNRIWR